MVGASSTEYANVVEQTTHAPRHPHRGTWEQGVGGSGRDCRRLTFDHLDHLGGRGEREAQVEGVVLTLAHLSGEQLVQLCHHLRQGLTLGETGDEVRHRHLDHIGPRAATLGAIREAIPLRLVLTCEVHVGVDDTLDLLLDVGDVGVPRRLGLGADQGAALLVEELVVLRRTLGEVCVEECGDLALRESLEHLVVKRAEAGEDLLRARIRDDLDRLVRRGGVLHDSILPFLLLGLESLQS